MLLNARHWASNDKTRLSLSQAGPLELKAGAPRAPLEGCAVDARYRAIKLAEPQSAPQAPVPSLRARAWFIEYLRMAHHCSRSTRWNWASPVTTHFACRAKRSGRHSRARSCLGRLVALQAQLETRESPAQNAKRLDSTEGSDDRSIRRIRCAWSCRTGRAW